jgi:acyl-CoA synthetase (AMP-forming)/AMP-acid ligase II
LSLNLQLSLNKALTLWSDRIAIADGSEHFTYAQFGARVASLAQYLLLSGLDTGAHVAVLAPNCHEYMEIYYACAMLGIVAIPLNFRLQANEIIAILVDSQASALFFHEDFRELGELALKEVPAIKKGIFIGEKWTSKEQADCTVEAYEDALHSCENAQMPVRNFENDHLAQLYYTSGTTGKPKGVMLTHLNVTSNALGCVAEFQFDENTVWGHFAPVFHLADAWSLFAVTWSGGKHVFTPYFKVQNVLEAISRESVTATVLVPTMVNQILGDPQLSSYDVSSLKLMTTAGSPIAPEQVRRVIKELKCDYLQFYGLTETSPFLTIGVIKKHLQDLPEEQLIQLKSRTGRPFISVTVKVVDEQGEEVKHDDKQVGEIIARGPNVTQGYWKQPDLSAQSIIDGWFHTGDLACIDENGYINIVDRKKDMIITGGENVFSTEVEYVLYEHGAVQECAVFGIPDEKWGEIVAAVVVLKPGASATDTELMTHVKQKLARYKVPRAVEFVKELPKTGSGKIFKKALRDKHWSASARQVN